MRPLFPFYGSKWRDARRYPAPGELAVEPFAGSAGYSLWYEPTRVQLYDVDPIIVGVWDYLIRATPADILALPLLEAGQSTDDLAIPQEARWLIGFWVNRGSAQPKKTMTDWAARNNKLPSVWGPEIRQRIAGSVDRVSHWTVEQSSYADIPTAPGATYFIDPPYVVKGRHYRYSALDYGHLSSWIRSLDGRVIACEQAGATWLPFVPHGHVKSTLGTSAEVVYLGGADR